MCNFVMLLYLKNGHNMLIAKKKYQINKIMNLLILKAIKFKPSIVFLKVIMGLNHMLIRKCMF